MPRILTEQIGDHDPSSPVVITKVPILLPKTLRSARLVLSCRSRGSIKKKAGRTEHSPRISREDWQGSVGVQGVELGV